ncbi:SAV_915 family protein [Actinoplanes sp. CA-131856]
MPTTPSGADDWPPDHEVAGGPVRPVIVPPFVYVPCAPLRAGDTELTVDLRQTRDGRLALLAYTALDRLVDCCGAEQPWTVMPTENLEEVRLATGFELILFDLEIPPEQRRHAEVS